MGCTNLFPGRSNQAPRSIASRSTAVSRVNRLLLQDRNVHAEATALTESFVE